MKVKVKVLALMTAGLIVLGSGFAAISYAKTAQPSPSAVTQAAPEAKGAPETKEASEAKGAPEADENLPGGGHQDPEGANVDHQFEGVE